MIQVLPTEQSCGAIVTGVDLSESVTTEDLQKIRAAWIEHHVLAFPDQEISDERLEEITQYFGVFGKEPFFEPIDGSEHVVSLCRRADETAPVFAEVWHSDWSFQSNPPIGTCLYSLTIPPVGGDTSFLNQEKALSDMPTELRQRIEGKQGIHSARGGYAPDGAYGEKEKDSDRSMVIKYSNDAYDTQLHPLISIHPESGRETLTGCLGYIIGIDGMEDTEGRELLKDLYLWQTRAEFQYQHKWQEKMFVIWDNRCVLHKANSGYDGYDRELHRTTVYAKPSLYASV
ncbi:MAG: taurine dioxygenase [Candidatus Azotimanducaceae bacterium]|jgi:taurine dioxygenase